MACRWPPPAGALPYNDFRPAGRPFHQFQLPRPFSPEACWAPSVHSWQNFPQPQQNAYHPRRNNNNKKRQRRDPVFIDFCDVCDRGFKNLAKKVEHFKQHIKCDEPGCEFEAHFKIVAIHKQNVHGPNAFKIQLETPEDIQRWRMERKRKYPTIANVEMKAKKALEKRESGDVLENKYFGKVRQRRCKKGESESSSAATSPVETPPSKPLSLLFCDSADSLVDSVSSDEEQSDRKVASTAANSVGLGSLMQSYASDSEADNSCEESPAGNGIEEHSPEETKAQPSRKMETYKNGLSSCNQPKQSSSRKSKSMKGKRKSLLEMLLAPEIRKERNHILQCVRYIVKNNFLENGDSN